MIVPEVNNLAEFNQHVLQEFPKEACGVLLENKFIPMINIAEVPTKDFKLDKQAYLELLMTGKVKAILHSHPCPLGSNKDNYGRVFDPRTPSMPDMASQVDTDVPWGIVSTEGENVSQILWFGLTEPADLIGRTFIHNVYDCYTLIRDYYALNFKIRLNSYPRPLEWQEFDKLIYERNFEKEGFTKVPADEPSKIGDLLMFKISAEFVNHAGIYVGNSRFLHHLYNRLSNEDVVGRWQKQLAYRIRHKDLV